MSAPHTESPQTDPITVEVIRNKLDGISNEMHWTLLSSSFSPIVKEGMDASAGLFMANGASLSQAHAIPAHLGALIPCIATILRRFPVAGMRPGDAYCMNDPYDGGAHVPDIALLIPVFVNDRVIALSATMSHHQDMGGMTPGSLPTNATDIYQEGVVIPPVKLIDQGVYNDTFVSMMRANIRLPDIFMGDLNAQVAAARVGARRLGELATSFGPGITDVFDLLLDRSETLTRQAITALPDGVYRSVDIMDNDGLDLDRRIRIEVAVIIEGSDITVDFTGTSDQVRGPFNSSPAATMAAVYYAIRAITGSDIPTNAGCFRPVHLVLPPSSFVNPSRPAPLNGRSIAAKLIGNNVIGALASVTPDRVKGYNGSQHILVFSGEREDGRPFVVTETIAAGTGAHLHGDGVDMLESDVANGMNMPSEAMEMDFPIRVERFDLRPDSGGAGEHRGGLGCTRVYLALRDNIGFVHRGQHHYGGPRGIAGGGHGGAARTVIQCTDGTIEVIPSKMTGKLNAGDRLILQTPGAGGFGDPRRRPRDLVRADVADGRVSAEQARDIYGLAD